MKHLRHFQYWIMPAVAIALFVNQLIHQSTDDLTAWKGAGMGMFASTDNGATRFLHIYGINAGGSSLLITDLPSPVPKTVRQAETLPTDANIERLANEIASHRLMMSDPVRKFLHLDSDGQPQSHSLRSVLVPESDDIQAGFYAEDNEFDLNSIKETLIF